MGEQVMVEGLLVGFIFALALSAALFFFKFWHATRDQLFLAFALAFALEGLSRLISLFVVKPNEGAPEIYLLRLIGYILIIAAIVRKNRRPRA
jgi:uncharacterized membrane protein HdeD (DUF308 family)